jgi:hypothetical protein
MNNRLRLIKPPAAPQPVPAPIERTIEQQQIAAERIWCSAHWEHTNARANLLDAQAECMRLQAVECDALADLNILNNDRSYANKLRTFACAARGSMEKFAHEAKQLRERTHTA